MLDSSHEDPDTLEKSAGANLLVNCPVTKCPHRRRSFPTLEPSSPFALFALDGNGSNSRGRCPGRRINGNVAVASGASLLTQSASSVTGNLYLGSGATFTGPLTVSGTDPDGSQPDGGAADR